ncbi:TLD domain-containing protein 2-like [Pollicipes pollicipes]|uniref:TLD domain-containing protein 2-like n=1 Tax=Pollicipes pollicipes TaxID=41117 RepID=UPI00188595E6|nr:TLD domain-containing protein 2-like [Pollicipes pollicipes]
MSEDNPGSQSSSCEPATSSTSAQGDTSSSPSGSSPAPAAAGSSEASTDVEYSPGRRTPSSRGSDVSSQRRRRLTSAVSVDERPELFLSVDELLRPPTPPPRQPPLYLRLMTGRPRGQRIPRSQTVIFCGQRRIRSELWFAVPRDCCDELYNAIREASPEICGGLDVTKPESRGYELIVSDDETIWEPEGEPEDAENTITDRSNRDAQPADASGENPAARGLESPGLGMALVPDLVGRTEIVTDEMASCVYKLLPARVEGHPWNLLFSTSEHGFSLKSLYRRAAEHECPMVLFVQDAEQHVFGAVSSDPIRMDPHYYGTGESFLFTFHPEFREFRWSGENQYFARGSLYGLEFGSGEGRSGLFLDEELYRGHTEPCRTYNNEPLTTSRDFLIHAVELWALA